MGEKYEEESSNAYLMLFKRKDLFSSGKKSKRNISFHDPCSFIVGVIDIPAGNKNSNLSGSQEGQPNAILRPERNLNDFVQQVLHFGAIVKKNSNTVVWKAGLDL